MPMTTAAEPGPRRSQRPPDGPVRRDRGVGERRGQHRVEVTERGELASAVDEHVLGHPAVDAEAPPGAGQLGDAVADVLVAGRQRSHVPQPSGP